MQVGDPWHKRWWKAGNLRVQDFTDLLEFLAGVANRLGRMREGLPQQIQPHTGGSS